MKKMLAIGAATLAFAAPLSAGALEEPVMEEAMIIEEAATSSVNGAFVVLALGLLMMIVAHDG